MFWLLGAAKTVLFMENRIASLSDRAQEQSTGTSTLAVEPYRTMGAVPSALIV